MLFTKRWMKVAVIIIAAVIAISFIIATAASASPQESAPKAVIHISQATAKSRFISMLNSLKVDSRPSSHTGYKRSLFKHWIDADHDGCNTRAEVLMSESSTSTTHSSTCTIRRGKWWSAYDNRTITSASSLDIDHFVPLSEAWKSGAYNWSASRRQAFANDLKYPLSLIAVSSSTNRSKGDLDPAHWLPNFRGYTCTYAATWIAVKYRWSLTVDALEKSVLRGLIGSCGATVRVPIPAKA
jgi:hypothetical protein